MLTNFHETLHCYHFFITLWVLFTNEIRKLCESVKGSLSSEYECYCNLTVREVSTLVKRSRKLHELF